MIPVYTDGASSPDGVGGWAWTDGSRSGSGHEFDTTNQRMEMLAALRAIEAYDDPICVHSDSAYVINCFEQQWYLGWQRNGWRNSQHKRVSNRDLWESLIAAVRERGTTFQKVKGHSGDVLNEEADRLAVAAKRSGQFLREQMRL